MVWCEQKRLILDIAANKELNAVADKTIDTEKRWNITADKKLNAAVDNVVNIDKRQYAADSK